MTTTARALHTFLAHARRRTDAGQPQASARRSLLVVDDEASVRRIAVTILKELGGYDVVDSGDPEAAIAMSATRHFDLAVVDVVMPAMRGDELANRLRARLWDLKVLYLTGCSHLLFADRPWLGEPEAFLEKPFSPDGLLQAVSLLLTGRVTPSP